jgi:NADPH2:quinone reductase
MRCWRVHEYGEPLAVLRLEDVPLPEPGDGEVRVRAQGIPFNLNDLERINGGNMMARPEFPYAPGMETMGVVDAAGAGAESLLGKRVAGSTVQAIGGYAEYALCTASATFEMPDDIPLPDAAALFFPFHLAWLGLFDRADLQAGETVLIHAAAGGSGSAAVQLAVDRGAHVIATCGTDEKAQLCRELGAQTVVNYTTDDFLAACMEVTGGKGVDVVFDNVGEAVMENGFKATAYNGRYVLMGFASNKVVADEKFIVPRQLSLGNFKLMSVMLSYADAGRQQFMKQFLGWNLASDQLGAEINAQIVELVRAGRVKAVVGTTLGFDEIPRGITDLSSRDSVGRVVALVD